LIELGYVKSIDANNMNHK